MKKYLTLFTPLALAGILTASPSMAFPQIEYKDYKLSVYQMFQIWNTFTIKNDLYDKSVKKNYDFLIRRGRLGLVGSIEKDFYFRLLFDFDDYNKNPSTITSEDLNKESSENIELLEGVWIWNNSKEFNFAVGYFLPQISRENITSGFRLISVDKGLAGYAVRKVLTGNDKGRIGGANVGGVFGPVSYSLGIQETNDPSIVGTRTNKNSLLATGRFTINIGEPEIRKYRLIYKESYLGKRKGATIGLNIANGERTSYISRNRVIGGDILVNYGPFDFFAEIDGIERKQNNDTSNNMAYTTKASFMFNNFIRPYVMYTGIDIDKDQDNNKIDDITGLYKSNYFEIGTGFLFRGDKAKFTISYQTGKKTEKNFSSIVTAFQLVF